MADQSSQAGPSNSSTASNAGAGKKRRNNVNKACENCRRRRIKCDGIRPSCGTCAVYKDECHWEAREDYRKPLSRGQVEALVTRVKDLERLLRQHGVDPGTGDGEASAMPDVAPKEEEAYRDEEVQNNPHDPRDWTLDHLVEREAGDLHLHGPTSAFRHLGRYPRERASALNIYPVTMPSPHLPIGYARFLPPNIALTQYEHDHCIDLYFKYYSSWCLRTNPLLFRQDMAASVHPPFLRTSHYSPMLHNAILSIALGYSDDPNLRHRATRKLFAAQAKSYIDEEGMNPTVATVQALAHLAAHHSLGAEHNLGWLYIGMSLRCAMALGLNTDSSKLLDKGQITPEQARARNVTFWTAVVQEGLWAPYIGRSISMPEYTTGLPVIDHELDQMVSEFPVWSEIKTQPSMLSTAFLETVKLMQIGNRIMNTLYGLKVDMPTVDQTGAISEISLALINWHENLPASVALNYASPKNALPHILMMHLSHAWLVILLHRPFYRPLNSIPGAPGEPNAAATRAASAVKQCDRAAYHVIQMLQIWHRLHNLRYTPPTALQVCFIAGTTHLLSLASSRSNSKKHVEAAANVDECVKLLRYMAVSWPAAEQARLLLDGLRTDYGLAGTVSVPQSPKKEDAAILGGVDQTPGSGSQTASSGVYGSGVSNDPFANAFTSTDFDLGVANMHTTGVNINPTNGNTGLDLSSLPTVSPGTNGFGGWTPNLAGPSTTTMPGSASTSGAFDLNDWQAFASPQYDRETQALLDNILQPHLSIGFPMQDWNDPQFRGY